MTKEATGDNIYQKLQQIRVDLQELGLKKTGNNTFTKIKYFELGDFLPSVNKLLNEHGLCTVFQMSKKSAKLIITDGSETARGINEIVFGVYTVAAEMKGAQAIQSHGATITYLRRYLMMAAFEIVESDLVDAESVIALEKSEIDKILAMDSEEELKIYCGDLKKAKGARYQKVILKYYNQRAKELRAK